MNSTGSQLMLMKKAKMQQFLFLTFQELNLNVLKLMNSLVNEDILLQSAMKLIFWD